MEEKNHQLEKKTLATAVYDGWVKRDHGNFVTIELSTPEGARDIDIRVDDCVDGKLLAFGRAVRYKAILEYASDLESELTPEELRDMGEIRELRPKHGKTGFYRIDE